MIDNISNRSKMVNCFDNVIYLNWLEGRADLVGTIDFFDLVSCQPVTGHTVGGVG